MGYATFWAYPVTDIKCKGVENMTTIETALRGRIPLVNSDKGTSIPSLRLEAEGLSAR